jgi:hypothetical protein
MKCRNDETGFSQQQHFNQDSQVTVVTVHTGWENLGSMFEFWGGQGLYFSQCSDRRLVMLVTYLFIYLFMVYLTMLSVAEVMSCRTVG